MEKDVDSMEEGFLISEMTMWNRYREMDPQLKYSDTREKLREYYRDMIKDLKYTITHLMCEIGYYDDFKEALCGRKVKSNPCMEYKKEVTIVLLNMDELRRRVISNPWSNKGTNLKMETGEEMIERMKHLNFEIWLNYEENMRKYIREPLISAEDLCNDQYLLYMMFFAWGTGIDPAPEKIYNLLLKGRLLGLHEPKYLCNLKKRE